MELGKLFANISLVMCSAVLEGKLLTENMKKTMLYRSLKLLEAVSENGILTVGVNGLWFVVGFKFVMTLFYVENKVLESSRWL